MKNFIFLTLFVCSATLFSFTNPSEESVYDGGQLGYHVERSQGVVFISLNLKNPEMFSEINILRSDKPNENYRKIKYLDSDKVSALNTQNIIEDKYPLPGSIKAYYKIQTIDKNGVQKTYPCVVLSR